MRRRRTSQPPVQEKENATVTSNRFRYLPLILNLVLLLFGALLYTFTLSTQNVQSSTTVTHEQQPVEILPQERESEPAISYSQTNSDSEIEVSHIRPQWGAKKEVLTSVPEDTCGIAVVFNPLGYKTRAENFHAFRVSSKKQNLKLAVLELAFKPLEEPVSYVLTPADADLLIQRTTSLENILWQKERLLNELVGIVLDKWSWCTKIIWCDTDMIFANNEWVSETSRALDTAWVVQPFSYVLRTSSEQARAIREDREIVQDMVATAPEGAKKEGMKSAGIAFTMSKAGPDHFNTLNQPHLHGYTGFAWAARRALLESNKLFDLAIVGGGDTLFAHALWGHFRQRRGIAHGGVSYKPYFYSRQFPISLRNLEDDYAVWAQNVWKLVQGNVSFVEGTAVHLWHGSKENRQYEDRFKILSKNRYNPNDDLAIDEESGAWRWNSKKVNLHNEVRSFFARRKEDDGS